MLRGATTPRTRQPEDRSFSLRACTFGHSEENSGCIEIIWLKTDTMFCPSVKGMAENYSLYILLLKCLSRQRGNRTKWLSGKKVRQQGWKKGRCGDSSAWEWVTGYNRTGIVSVLICFSLHVRCVCVCACGMRGKSEKVRLSGRTSDEPSIIPCVHVCER